MAADSARAAAGRATGEGINAAVSSGLLGVEDSMMPPPRVDCQLLRR